MAVKKVSPNIVYGYTTEPYSPPYPIPRSNTRPTPTPVMRTDEPFSPSYEIPRRTYQEPRYAGRVTQPYTPPSELSRYQNRTTYQKTRARRLV